MSKESSNAMYRRIRMYYVLQATPLQGTALDLEPNPPGALDLEPNLQRPHTTSAPRSPLPQRSPKSQRKRQSSSRRLRRSRVDLACCIDLLGLTFTNLTLCWITLDSITGTKTLNP